MTQQHTSVLVFYLVLKYLINIFLLNWAFYHRETFELISYQRDDETLQVRSSRLRPCQSSSEASPAWRRGGCWKYQCPRVSQEVWSTWWTGGTPPCPRSHCCPCRWPWRRERPGRPSPCPPWLWSPWSPSPPSPGSPWCCRSSWHTGQTPPWHDEDSQDVMMALTVLTILGDPPVLSRDLLELAQVLLTQFDVQLLQLFHDGVNLGRYSEIVVKIFHFQ